MQHPNVISYRAAFIDEASSSLCLVLEFANGGDLNNKIKFMKERDQMFTEETILKVLVQAALGLQALHSLRIMHRDLKVSQKIALLFRVQIFSYTMTISLK